MAAPIAYTLEDLDNIVQATALLDRYTDKTDSQSCWPWRGWIGYGGYGYLKVRIGGRWVRLSAHRLTFLLHNKALPEPPLLVLHRCHNRICCNPAHLKAGSQQENIDDMVAAGRQARGDRSGSRTHPERRPRGDRHGSRTHPERVPRGERSGAYKHPERVPRGDQHYARRQPERVARGDRHGSRTHPERVPHGDKHWSRRRPDRVPRGERHSTAKLTAAQVAWARERLVEGWTQTRVAKVLGVSPSLISMIKNRKLWTDAP